MRCAGTRTNTSFPGISGRCLVLKQNEKKLEIPLIKWNFMLQEWPDSGLFPTNCGI